MSFDFSTDLLPHLESITLERFDLLLKRGDIYYEAPKIEVVQLGTFQIQFNITPSLTKKPVMSPDDIGRSKPVGPFVDPPEDFIIARIGKTHTLIINKYCVYRPMVVLHTSLFAPQTDDLDEIDLAAAWTILRRFKSPQMIIYNCGVDAGSSQGHKHLQIFPRSDSEEFHLWPSKATSIDEISKDISGVPFKHFVLRLPGEASAEYIYECYRRLLRETKVALRDANAGCGYNLILVSEWLALIPRRHKGKGLLMANAANMLGSLWVRSDELRDQLLESSVLDTLSNLGIPFAGTNA